MEKWYLDKGFDSNSKHAECWRLDVLLFACLSLSLTLSLSLFVISKLAILLCMWICMAAKLLLTAVRFICVSLCSVDVCLHPTFQVFPESCNENDFVDRKWLSVPR